MFTILILATVVQCILSLCEVLMWTCHIMQRALVYYII